MCGRRALQLAVLVQYPFPVEGLFTVSISVSVYSLLAFHSQ